MYEGFDAIGPGLYFDKKLRHLHVLVPVIRSELCKQGEVAEDETIIAAIVRTAGRIVAPLEVEVYSFVVRNP